jgi:hypothetical protein
MKRVLLLTMFVFLTCILMPSPPVRTQRPTNAPPNPDSFPAAGPECKNRVQLSPWIGTPSVDFPNTARCILRINTCSGLKEYKSDARAVGEGLCSDFWAVHRALVTREICCDGEGAEKPEESKNRACDPPPPDWFTASDCKDLQSPTIQQTGNNVTIFLCGYQVFSGTKPAGVDPRMFQEELESSLRKDMPRKVCCNRFRDAARTGAPCNARADIDCDGVLNDADLSSSGIPAIDGRGFTIATATIANYDLFPEGMSEDEIMPPADQCKNCKWELIKGELNCSTDGIRDHAYRATWRCPATGAQAVKTHTAKATAPCNRSARSTPPVQTN